MTSLRFGNASNDEGGDLSVLMYNRTIQSKARITDGYWLFTQTGSGKTYTMGTGYTVGGSTDGVIPQVMEFIFRQVGTLRKKADFQIRVSFIEVCVAARPVNLMNITDLF